MDSLTIRPPDTEALSRDLSPVVARAIAMTVRDVTGHAAAQVAIRDLRTGEKRIEDAFADPKSAAAKAHKSICALEKSVLAPLQEARRVLNDKCDSYEAEARRIAEEQRRKAETDARKAEEERHLMDAIAAEAEGDTEEAEAILAEPVITPVVRVQPAVARVDGVSSRQVWKAEVTGMGELIAYVAAHPEWTHLLEPAMPALNGLARSQREAMNIPGVRAVPETIRATR